MTADSISAPDFQCVGLGEDDIGRRYILMECDGKRIEPLLFATLSEDARFFSALRAANVPVVTRAAKAAFMLAVQSAPREVTHYIASRTGFHLNNSVFLLPGNLIGEPQKDLEISLGHLDSSMQAKYRSQGSLSDWQNTVLPLCENNSRLVFSLCFSFASAVAGVDPDAIKGGGWELVGNPECGKTTGGMVAGSPWGHHLGQAENGFCEDWNSSVHQLEPTLAAHNNIGIVLDEILLFEGNQALAIMRLAEGDSKRRMTVPGRTMARSFFLGTANDPVWVRVGGSTASLGATISRCFDIPPPRNGFGMFDDLRGFASGGELSEAIKTACRQTFGTAGPQFVASLLNDLRDEPDNTLRFVRECRMHFKKKARKKALKQNLRLLERPLDRFATGYAAGRLAVDYGILPWDGKAIMDALFSCLIDGVRCLPLEFRKIIAKPAPEVLTAASPMERLQTYVSEHLTEFKKVGPNVNGDAFGRLPGYLGSFNGKKWIYFEAKTFRRVVGGKAESFELLAQLSKDDLADVPSGGISVQRPFFRADGNKGWHRVIAVRRAAFDAGRGRS